jgi:hypothetical protein
VDSCYDIKDASAELEWVDVSENNSWIGGIRKIRGFSFLALIVMIGVNWLLEWNFREKFSRVMSETVRKNSLLFAVFIFYIFWDYYILIILIMDYLTLK